MGTHMTVSCVSLAAMQAVAVIIFVISLFYLWD